MTGLTHILATLAPRLLPPPVLDCFQVVLKYGRGRPEEGLRNLIIWNDFQVAGRWAHGGNKVREGVPNKGVISSNVYVS